MVVVPAGMAPAEEAECVERMVRRVEAGERRKGEDLDLAGRARALSEKYLGGRARASSVRWVSNQTTRWGSCTPAEGTIRLSHHLQGMPGWVVDYVLLHELAHLLVPRHGPAFWSVLEPYPHTDRARGFLHGVAHAWRTGEGAHDGSEAPGLGDDEDCVPT